MKLTHKRRPCLQNIILKGFAGKLYLLVLSSGVPALHSRWVVDLAETVFREQGFVSIN